jgi:hypothetical protein
VYGDSMTIGHGVRAALICGAGHSGSTLLGMVLGSHSRAFYMGEGGKVRFLNDPKKPMRKRVCKICGERCPVWAGFVWDQSRPLYQQVSEHVDRSLIIDSTKDEAWIRARSAEVREAGGQAALIFLTRDGRAVVNSRIRKYPDRDPADQIRAWVKKIESSEALFEEFPGPKLKVRYEDLAVGSERTARALCEVLGLEFEPRMLRFAETQHHVLGGNSGTQYIAAKARFDDPEDAFVTLNDRTRDYYREHSGEIELDLRWKRELSVQHAALFDQLAGGANESMRWEA